PYARGYDQIAVADLEKQANIIANELKTQGVEQENLAKKEIVALIAYLQRLGTDIKPEGTASN
ncbi:MAG: cbb3-type cytochrome c oxidase subunit II, partial [Bacteroidia bacterium]|nr:cbb3-type cytochrome c oxidase subunit II [Bacteroidia bacterium]